MARTMYDSVTPSAIPRNAEMVAGYLAPSRYAWSAADWALFPNAVKVRIAIFASVNDGHVLDVEPGDATPAQAPGWVRMRRAAGVDPTVYCNYSTWPSVRAEFDRQKVAQPHYWIAKYDGAAQMIPGAVAKQYANPPLHGRGHFDLSIVADHWPGVDTTRRDNDMELTDRADWEKVNDLGPAYVGHKFLGTWQNAKTAAKNSNVIVGLLKKLQGDVDETEARILGAIADVQAGDVEELADALLAKLGPGLGAEVVAEIGRKLATL